MQRQLTELQEVSTALKDQMTAIEGSYSKALQTANAELESTTDKLAATQKALTMAQNELQMVGRAKAASDERSNAVGRELLNVQQQLTTLANNAKAGQAEVVRLRDQYTRETGEAQSIIASLQGANKELKERLGLLEKQLREQLATMQMEVSQVRSDRRAGCAVCVWTAPQFCNLPLVTAAAALHNTLSYT